MHKYNIGLKPTRRDTKLTYCTAKTPNEDADHHLDSKILPSTSDYTDDYKCPHCGRIFTIELPE